MKRRLSAILAADVVGFSRLMEVDEESTVQTLNRYREAIDRLVTDHYGRVFGTAGDSVIAEFASPVEAVRCAVKIQNKIQLLSSGVADESRMSFRIGVNLGDVIVDGENLLGDGVNVAARLESIADPDGITLSRSVYDLVRKAVDLHYEDLGELKVKNIEEPIRAYRVVLTNNGQQTEGKISRPKKPEKPSIAVLPFDNMSGDPEQEYFSDGITEDIITALSHFKAFPVIARNSTFTYKGQAIRVQQIAEELGARYVIEGSVRKAGERIRITAQLIDAETGHHVWAEKYDATIENIFDVQDEMTLKIVSTVQPELALVELKKAAIKRPENLTAWDLVLQGMALANKHTDDDHESARKLFQSAIELDPNYTDAWSGLAWSYLANLTLKGPDERQDFIERGLQAAMRAVELDDRSAFAHYVLGVAYVWGEQIDRGISQGEISLQLNPYHAQTHMGLGNRLDLAGRTDEGINKMEQALQLSPRDPFCSIIMAYLSRAYLSLEQPDKANEWIEKSVNLQPKNPDLRYRYAICLAHLDRVAEAKSELENCDKLQPGFLATREKWRPYSDDTRNQRFFAGIMRHGLIYRG